jgi:phage N-6-adenine-methyltransferase
MLSSLINTAEQRTLRLTQIRRDGGTQPREGIDWEHVKDMQRAITAGDALPAVSVVYDGADYWLYDGFHRWHAYAYVGKLEIPVIIQQGTQDDAQWESLAANRTHGLKRTQADKERAIRAALKHPKSAGLSNLAISRHLGVDDKTVGKYRDEMEASSEIPKIDQRTVERNGQTYTQNTANIGANRPPTEPARRMSEQYEITPIVHGVVRQRNASAADLRMTARNRSGAIWQECLAAVPTGQWVAHRDLAQALNNVAYDIELRAANAAASAAPVGHVSNVTEPATQAAPPAAPLPAWAGDDSPAGDALVETLQDLAEPEQPAPPAGKLLVDYTEEDWEAARIAEKQRVEAAIKRLAAERKAATEAVAPAAPEPADPLPVSQRADYESDEWYTPQEYIEAARQVMGAIDLDPASSELAQTVVQAGAYLTRFDDGLRQMRWLHQRIWLNPPYSNPGPWIEKLVSEHQAGPYCTEAIVLVNNATETSWFQLLLERYPLCLPARRLAFWRHDHANVGARQGQAFFYLGPNAAKFQEIFSQFGPILRRLS